MAAQPLREIDVLWITAGLSCDGDTISMTAATQPSLEDLALGIIPGIPKVNFHNPVLAYQVGETSLPSGAREGKSTVHPRRRRLDPNEKIKAEGYWALGNDEKTGQPRHR
jgi:hydrogenase small subunit